MNVSIIGITGFIGSNLSRYLIDQGINVMGIFRKDFASHEVLKKKIEKSEVVINLSGFPVAGVWTKRKKRKIYESRILVTKRIVELINESKRDLIYINASAVGIYNNENIHSERSLKHAKNFLADVVIDWEKEITKITNKGVRWIILRMGIVIGKNGGYLGKQNFMLKRGISIIVGNKDEYLPLISLNELLNIVVFIIKNKRINGVVNAVAPFMVKVGEFYRCLGIIKGIKVFIKVPDIWIRIILGEASLIFLEGQCVVPEKLMINNYHFRDKKLLDMLVNVLNDK